jgi:hypothetical protein
MDATATLFLVTAVVLPLLLMELGDWCPRLAAGLARFAARRLGIPSLTDRYSEEWLAILDRVPGKLSRLAVAISLLAYTPWLRLVLRRPARVVAPVPASPLRSPVRPSADADQVSQSHAVTISITIHVTTEIPCHD